MQAFGYERPQTLDRAVALLDSYGPDARPLAGGTDLIIGMRQRALLPKVVVDLKAVPELRPDIRLADGQLSVSADTVMSDLAADNRIRAQFPALAEAAAVVGAVQIRNRATLVGNICNASPAADTAPALLAYDALVVAFGPGGTRRIPIEAFFTGPGQTTLARGELVIAIELPVPAAAGRVRVRPADPAPGRGPGYGQRVRVRRWLGRDPARSRGGRPAPAAGHRPHRGAGRPGRRPGRAGGHAGQACADRKPYLRRPGEP